ncbi:response regulator transcription factor [Clostridium ganghwense]|uniref:Stage 0 sporulation protein A homolog n=1 Tax=Clostridium ganghwense TaxID=312089 RepID=A0ABT4CQ75_9CLOT|nr:response regulator transcription factor [Clostridium ganghwense]MCY6370603.1 response regulator transcription factor [Clostridium ganghwense]
MKSVLIVEDDEGLSRGMSFSFNKAGYKVYTAFNLKSANKLIKQVHIDMIILDLNLPDGNGIDFCKEIRKSSSVPIIMLTARDLETDEVEGLYSGADDYITKPFSLSVLMARVNSIFRRSVDNSKSNEIKSGDIVVNLDNLKVYKKDKELTISSTEFKLLKYLMKNKGQVLLKEQILSSLWDDSGNFVDENTLPVTIRRLRKKIEDDSSNPEYIKTVHGMGYMWSEK